MNDTTSPHSARQRHSPVRDSSTPQMRAVRKELLLLRAEIERAEFVQARAELHRKFSSFGWMKLVVPGFGAMRGKSAGRGINATLSELVLGHPLVTSLVSLLLRKPLRKTVAAGAKPLLKWGAVGAAALTALRVWRGFSSHGDRTDETSDES